MLAALPPYAVAPPAFPFPALAAHAGQAPLGGQREAVLACYVAARLAHDAIDGGPGAVPPSLRTARAKGARAWLAALNLPSTIRTPIGRLIDASAAGDPGAMRAPLASVIAVTAPLLDTASRSELDRLAQALVA